MLGQTLNHRYLITAQIGKGAMGTVYRATDAQTGQDVAVKVLSLDLVPDPEILERFRREGEAVRRLRHPNIVGFVDMFEHGHQLAIVMEYMPGGSLHTLIRQQGALPVARARHIALDLCDALIRAHRLGIIHRDIKPENVMLAEDGSPKLTDFGVAHLTSENNRLTATGTQVGTPYYMSPEAWEGQPLDVQADIWSLGVVLFEMLSGQLPFGGSTAAAVMTKVLMTPPPDLRQLRPEVPPDLAHIVVHMLARDRSLRYQTIREASLDLEQAESLRPAVASAESATSAPPATVTSHPRAKPAPGRLRWVAGLAGLGVIVVLGLAAARLFPSAPATPSRPAVTADPTLSLSPVPTQATIAVLDPPTANASPSPTPALTATLAPKALPSSTAAVTAAHTATAAVNATTVVTAPVVANGPTGRIAFVSDRNGSQEVYVINADGTGLIQVTDTLGNKEGGLAWRPDGAALTFTWVGSLYTISPTAQATPQLLFAGSEPVWSPDGQRLIYSFSGGVYVAQPTPRQLLAEPRSFGSTITWSADSRNIFFALDSGLYSLEVDTGLRHKIAPLPAWGWAVAWSPDGTRLVGLAAPKVGRPDSVAVADHLGVNPIQLTSEGGHDSPAWSPDGQYIVYCSNRDGNNEIYVIKADGTGQTNLTRNPADDCPANTHGPAWGP